MNKSTLVRSEFLNEQYTFFKHESGLKVYVFPKKLSTSYAVFATKYGSLENKFKSSKDTDFTTVPDGIAHFLEHKMFENENGEDTFAKYAKYGANANAYTSNNITAYLFSSTDNFYESLEILLDFVTKPYFTKETVQKEQGIIAQEIRMYDDNPVTRLYYELLGALYKNHNVKINVAGTVKSISEITPELLYFCYNTFYNLNNMALCVCGEVKEEKVRALCDKMLKKSDAQTITREYPSEDENVNKQKAIAYLPVSKPLFAIGVKDIKISDEPMVRLRKKASADIACKMMFGKTSEFFNSLYDAGLISGDLHAEYEHNESFSFISLDGKSDNPDEVFARFLDYIEECKKSPLSKAAFERAKRVRLAGFIGLFDSSEDIANEFLPFIFDGVSIFDYADILRSITYEEALDFINEAFKKEHTSLAKVLPLEEKEV